MWIFEVHVMTHIHTWDLKVHVPCNQRIWEGSKKSEDDMSGLASELG